MEYIYAVLLLHETGKEITADNVKKVLNSVGIETNEALLNAVLAALEGIDLNKIKEEALAIPSAATVTTQQVTPQQTTKEEKKEEKKEEQALEGLSALFGF